MQSNSIRESAKLLFHHSSFYGVNLRSAKLKRTETAIEEYRAQIDGHKAENYGFASMAAVPYAHIVAKILSNKHPKGTDIALAPNPRDIVHSFPHYSFPGSDGHCI
jgi:hypothetical protein